MSVFFERKMQNLFSRLDFDSSDSISQDDFEKWSQNLISLGNLGSDKAGELRKNILRLWENYFAPADKNGDGDISFPEFFAHIKETLNDENKRGSLKETLPLIFDAIDTDQSGSISKEEFVNYYKSLNINDVDAAYAAFDAMDTSADGSLSREEFAEFGNDFFLSSDESNPAKHFFGPLP